MHRLFRKITTFVILTSMLFPLTSCYTDFEPDMESKPVVCLNSLITAGEPVKVDVTRTWRYSEGSPSAGFDITLRDAEVFLYVNDAEEEKMTFTTEIGDYSWEIKYYYEAKYIPKSGDRLKIKAFDKTYGEATAEVTVPYPVEIDGFETRITKNDYTFDPESKTFNSVFDMILRISFTDPESIINYYIFDMQTRKFLRLPSVDNEPMRTVESVGITPDYGFEPIFSEHISPLETIITDAYGLYTVFSDRQISGKQYSLEIPISGQYFCDYGIHPQPDDKLSIEVDLGHISTAYYNYMLSLWAATEGISGALGDVGLGDAVFEFSNVSTGAGIVATKANSTIKLNFYDILTHNQ